MAASLRCGPDPRFANAASHLESVGGPIVEQNLPGNRWRWRCRICRRRGRWVDDEIAAELGCSAHAATFGACLP